MQALIAGNTVIIKPSEVTPYSGKLAVDLFTEAGIPQGVIQVAMGDGQTGAALVGGGLDKVHFTGSVATGRRIAQECASQLIPCTLELGGNDAMIGVRTPISMLRQVERSWDPCSTPASTAVAPSGCT
ncbi:MAG: aldehyde dehydrogenase family protein [Microthrixaceae bacterium]